MAPDRGQVKPLYLVGSVSNDVRIPRTKTHSGGIERLLTILGIVGPAEMIRSNSFFSRWCPWSKPCICYFPGSRSWESLIGEDPSSLYSSTIINFVKPSLWLLYQKDIRTVLQFCQPCCRYRGRGFGVMQINSFKLSACRYKFCLICAEKTPLTEETNTSSMRLLGITSLPPSFAKSSVASDFRGYCHTWWCNNTHVLILEKLCLLLLRSAESLPNFAMPCLHGSVSTYRIQPEGRAKLQSPRKGNKREYLNKEG